MSEYAWQVNSEDRCQQCKTIAYGDNWTGSYNENGYLCRSCQTSHFHGDLNKEIERLRWEIVKLRQENKDLQECLLTALAAQKE